MSGTKPDETKRGGGCDDGSRTLTHSIVSNTLPSFSSSQATVYISYSSPLSVLSLSLSLSPSLSLRLPFSSAFDVNPPKISFPPPPPALMARKSPREVNGV